jgi:hypothetical protein
VVGAPPAGRSSVPLALRPAPVIAVLFARTARRLCYRQDPPHDPACKLRPFRDRAVTAVTGVIAVRAVIAGIVLPGPVRAARTVAKGAVPPVTSMPAVTAVTIPSLPRGTQPKCLMAVSHTAGVDLNFEMHWLNLTSLLVCGCFLQCHYSSAVFLTIRSVRILDSIVKTRPLVWLCSSAWDAVKLACQKAVFIFPGH